jgi:acetoin utilization protein AcuB
MTVREAMTTALRTVGPGTPIVEARQQMQMERVRHLLVTDEDGRLCGIVTDRDIRLNLPSPATSLSVWEINYLLTRLTVREVMSKGVVKISPDRDITEAARVMVTEKIGALPVLDGERLVGILTETDVVAAVANRQVAAVGSR